MIDGSILQTLSTWVQDNWAASAIAGGITWDMIKEYLLIPAKNALGKFFVDDKQIEEYLESLCNNKAINNKKPLRDAEDKYEEIVGKDIPEGFNEAIKQLIIESKEIIEEMNNTSKEKNLGNGVFNIKEQKANRDINNVNGTQIIMNK